MKRLVALCIPLALAACGKDEAANRPRPPLMVGTMAAATADFAPTLLALGTVAPRQTVAVRPRADGEIVAVTFREGDFVRAGQVLFRIDDRQARAALGQARATLASAVAAEASARSDFERAQALVGKGFISGTILDQRRAAAGSARAGIESARAQVKAAEAALSFLTVTAPISGRTGELGYRLGANVRAADATPLVTINQLSPIHVRFLVPPEQVQAARALLNAEGGRVLARARGSEDGGAVLASGRLVFLDNNVDPGNGAIIARAEFANPDERLWPGGIVDVELPLGAARPHIAVPESALQTGRDAPFVWTVAGGKAAMRNVSVAGRLGGRVYLASGVNAGDTVIVDTLAKLKPGDKVRTRPVTVAAAGGGSAQRSAS